MNMTHYMELLSTNQPWNLLIFMAVPIVLAEIAVTELYILYTREYKGRVRMLNRFCSIVVGLISPACFSICCATPSSRSPPRAHGAVPPT
jgi:hypothetical protein